MGSHFFWTFVNFFGGQNGVLPGVFGGVSSGCMRMATNLCTSQLPPVMWRPLESSWATSRRPRPKASRWHQGGFGPPVVVFVPKGSESQTVWENVFFRLIWCLFLIAGRKRSPNAKSRKANKKIGHQTVESFVSTSVFSVFSGGPQVDAYGPNAFGTAAGGYPGSFNPSLRPSLSPEDVVNILAAQEP